MPALISSQAAEDCRPATKTIGQAADQDGADCHADQFHGQHDPQCRAVDTPLGGNARRCETDRQHIETIQSGEKDAHDDGVHLQPAHGGHCQYRSRIAGHSIFICLISLGRPP
jgi:hypothetical protein